MSLYILWYVILVYDLVYGLGIWLRYMTLVDDLVYDVGSLFGILFSIWLWYVILVNDLVYGFGI